jgi:hypothetical protein
MGLFPLGYISQGGGATAGGYELISTTVLGSATNTVTLSSIPTTYKHLRVVLTGRSNFANTGFSNIFMRINGDTGSNYWHHLIEVSGSAFYASNSGSIATQARIGLTSQNNSATGYWAASQIDIPDYTSTNKNKTARVFTRSDNDAGTGYMDFGSAMLVSTSAVSSLSFYLDQGDWIANSRFSLYGISA